MPLHFMVCGKKDVILNRAQNSIFKALTKANISINKNQRYPCVCSTTGNSISISVNACTHFSPRNALADEPYMHHKLHPAPGIWVWLVSSNYNWFNI